jgi:hypothetical protein
MVKLSSLALANSPEQHAPTEKEETCMTSSKGHRLLYCSGCRATSSFIKTDRGYHCIGNPPVRPGCDKILTLSNRIKSHAL